MVDRVKIGLTSSLITMQNLVAVSHAACADVGGPKNRGMLGTGAWADPPETRYSSTGIIILNFVALGQTVWVYVRVPKFW